MRSIIFVAMSAKVLAASALVVVIFDAIAFHELISQRVNLMMEKVVSEKYF